MARENFRYFRCTRQIARTLRPFGEWKLKPPKPQIRLDHWLLPDVYTLHT